MYNISICFHITFGFLFFLRFVFFVYAPHIKRYYYIFLILTMFFKAKVVETEHNLAQQRDYFLQNQKNFHVSIFCNLILECLLPLPLSFSRLSFLSLSVCISLFFSISLLFLSYTYKDQYRPTVQPSAYRSCKCHGHGSSYSSENSHLLVFVILFSSDLMLIQILSFLEWVRIQVRLIRTRIRLFKPGYE